MDRIFEAKRTIDGKNEISLYDLDDISGIRMDDDGLSVLVGGALWATALEPDQRVVFIQMWKEWKEGKR